MEVLGYGVCLCGIALYNYMKYQHYKATHGPDGRQAPLAGRHTHPSCPMCM
jgi:hypothetical protein